MDKSWQLGTFGGIPLKIHWSFLLISLFITYTIFVGDQELWQSFAYAMVAVFVFVSVILHEYGHALTGKRFGIKTKDIILSPIGGVARMERIPENPVQELLITIAGPLVNLVIGLVIALTFYIIKGDNLLSFRLLDMEDPYDYVRLLAPINFTLFAFNLIPAFPMDGGRILRALLTFKFGRLKATKIASIIGRGLAIMFVILGIFEQHLVLSLIGIFIYMMAGQEYTMTRLSSQIDDVKVADIMRTSFSLIHLGDTYNDVIEKYYRTGEQNFLVVDSLGNLSGTIPEVFIKKAIQDKIQSQSVSQMMSHKHLTIDKTTLLKDLIDVMREEGLGIVAIGDQQYGIIGVIDRHNIENYLETKKV